MRDNIILIGMPASGKSTLGVVAAKYLGLDFVDCDIVIQRERGETLASLIERLGVDGFLDVECDVLSRLSPPRPSVIATGGSAVLREAAMEHLRSLGTVVYLRVSLEAIERRISEPHARGVAMRDGETLADVYAGRAPLYEKYADVILDEGNDTQQALAARLAEMFRRARDEDGSQTPIER